MAGYRVERTVYVLEFEDPRFNGMIIKAHGFTTLEGMHLDEVLDGYPTGERFERYVRMFTDRIVEWNLEDANGEVIPISYDAFMAQEPAFTLPVFRAWRDAIMGIPAPLGKEPSNGNIPDLGSIPMETLTPEDQQN